MYNYDKMLVPIKEACEKIWKDPHHIHYTNHGIEHSESIIRKLSKLLNDQNEKLMPVEKFILDAACYLHDIGMQCAHPILLENEAQINRNEKFPFNYELLEKIRSNHGRISSCRAYLLNVASIARGLASG